jgi:hypothetical protein
VSWSTSVALALFALFVLYVTAKGRLPQYLAVLFGQVVAGQGEEGGSTAATATSGALTMAQQAISTLNPLVGVTGGANTTTDSAGVTTTTDASGAITDVSGGGDFGTSAALGTGGL